MSGYNNCKAILVFIIIIIIVNIFHHALLHIVLVLTVLHQLNAFKVIKDFILGHNLEMF